MNKAIQIWVNGEQHPFSASRTLTHLLEELQIPSQYIAVAINEAIIPHSEMALVELQEGDRVEVVRAVAGG